MNKQTDGHCHFSVCNRSILVVMVKQSQHEKKEVKKYLTLNMDLSEAVCFTTGVGVGSMMSPGIKS